MENSICLHYENEISAGEMQTVDVRLSGNALSESFYYELMQILDKNWSIPELQAPPELYKELSEIETIPDGETLRLLYRAYVRGLTGDSARAICEHAFKTMPPEPFSYVLECNSYID